VVGVRIDQADFDREDLPAGHPFNDAMLSRGLESKNPGCSCKWTVKLVPKTGDNRNCADVSRLEGDTRWSTPGDLFRPRRALAERAGHEGRVPLRVTMAVILPSPG
jgi:hypothetical protein